MRRPGWTRTTPGAGRRRPLHGQKVAAVVAETEAAAEEGCRRLEVDYEILPAVIDPAEAIEPGAPAIHHDKTAEQRVANAARNIVRRPTANSAMSPQPSLAPRSAIREVHHPAGPARRSGNPWRPRLGRRLGHPERPFQHADAVPDAACADGHLQSRADRVRGSANASAAASAASRKCSSRISWRWRR